ncbi:phosphotransferase family protein [Halovivax cerinus]|uniref:Phosphotransferase family protein n=1 Tax=Halovivax cerinus TaxID=1487865 RepID=A0ABD5NRV0_9EURY|nr:phosphotransferase [Halovivax cerinus]
MSELPADERIEARLGPRFERVEIERRLHAVPPHEVYEVSVDGRRAVWKASVTDRGAAGVEGRVLRFVGRETSIPVPEVRDVGEDWFLAAYREDAPAEPADDERVLDRSWLRIAGRTLATLHDEARFDRPGLLTIDGDPADPASGIRVEAATDGNRSGATPDAAWSATADTTWSDALDDLLRAYEASVVGTGYESAIADARNFLVDHADRFDVLDGGAALCHGWFTPDHVGVAGDVTTCVIDFEHALAGSPEWDYWRTAVPLFQGGGWEGPDDAEGTFRDAYESVRPLPDGFDERADAYRAFVAASHIDSLATQRGIDAETREVADFLAAYIGDTLDTVRNS